MNDLFKCEKVKVKKVQQGFAIIARECTEIRASEMSVEYKTQVAIALFTAGAAKFGIAR